jgi:Uma2 family endonuclease
MAVEQRMSEEAYQRLVFSEPDIGKILELHDGRVVEKPGTTWEHGNINAGLGFLLQHQLDRAEFRVFHGLRLRWPPATIYIPDVFVIPTAYGDEFRGRDDILAIFTHPAPLVVEVWNTIGGYDVDAKIPIYQQRGDLEIWRIHPYERTTIVRRRQPDGSYEKMTYREGVISPMALPNVTIDLAALFAE